MIETNRTTLDNGLRIIHNYDASTAMCAVNILYNVGARDERAPLRGLAHLFEHLMFGGSVNIPEFDSAIEHAGGKNNAWTSADFTNFYDIIPAQNIETVFWLESDRMLSLAFSERSLEVQRSVVIEEFKQQCLNRPYGDLDHYMRSLVYKVHPYGVPVIGREPADIERVTMDDVRRFFFSHYAPNNAVLAVSGNLKFDEVVRLAEKWFGPIESRQIEPRHLPQEPEQHQARRLEVSGNVPQTDITIAYRMDGYGTKEYFCADLLTDLLANGQSSRFYRDLLIGTDLFTSADASILGSEDPGLLLLNGRLIENSPEAEAKAIEAMQKTAAALIDAPPSEYELTRAVNRMDSARTFGNINYLNKAQTLAMAEFHDEDINSYIDSYRSITPADISDCARRIFNPDSSSTLIYRPA